ncbi:MULTISPECIES: siroheme synthase CysG [unclassified Marinovum]
MKSFPMFIRTTGRRVVIAGGGEQAAQKARLMLKTDAQIVLAAPELDPELQALVDEGRATHHGGPITATLFEGAAMGFIATGCPGLDSALHGVAKAGGCAVNVVDRPDLCDLTTPSLVDRDPVVVAIGTEGTAPVLARQIKTQVEQMLAPNLGGLAAFAGRMRAAVAQRVPQEQRRAFWRWVFAEAPRKAWTRGAEREAANALKSAIAAGRAPDAEASGSIALVGAGPGARDLLTLRAVQRMQEADVIFYDRLVDEEILELARRDAERVYVGKVVGAHAWPQERINAVIVAAALKGQRVVRLKSGDPGIFGRATEEIEAAGGAGIPVEIVPGVTAAFAAAASTGRSLTERGVSDTLILTTGTCREGDALPDCARHAAPGTTLALYMGVRQSARIVAGLRARGMPGTARVCVAVEVSKPGERHFDCTLDTLTETLQTASVQGVATMLVTWPKTGAVAGYGLPRMALSA